MVEFAVSYSPIFTQDVNEDADICFRIDGTVTNPTLFKPIVFPSGKPLFDGDELLMLVPMDPYDYDQWHEFDLKAIQLSIRGALSRYLYLMQEMIRETAKQSTAVMYFVTHLIIVHRNYPDVKQTADAYVEQAIKLDPNNWMYHHARAQFRRHQRYFNSPGHDYGVADETRAKHLFRQQHPLWRLHQSDTADFQKIASYLRLATTPEAVRMICPESVWQVCTMQYQQEAFDQTIHSIMKIRKPTMLTLDDADANEPYVILYQMYIRCERDPIVICALSQDVSPPSDEYRDVWLQMRTLQTWLHEIFGCSDKLFAGILYHFGRFFNIHAATPFMQERRNIMHGYCNKAYQCARFQHQVQQYEMFRFDSFSWIPSDMVESCSNPLRQAFTCDPWFGDREPFLREQVMAKRMSFDICTPVANEYIEFLVAKCSSAEPDNYEGDIHKYLVIWFDLAWHDEQTRLVHTLIRRATMYRFKFLSNYKFVPGLVHLRLEQSSVPNDVNNAVEYFKFQHWLYPSKEDCTAVVFVCILREMTTHAVNSFCNFIGQKTKRGFRECDFYWVLVWWIDGLYRALFRITDLSWFRIVRLELEATFTRLVDYCEREAGGSTPNRQVHMLTLNRFVQIILAFEHIPNKVDQYNHVDSGAHLINTKSLLNDLKIFQTLLKPFLQNLDIMYSQMIRKHQHHVINQIHRLSRVVFSSQSQRLPVYRRCLFNVITTTMAQSFGSSQHDSTITGGNVNAIIDHGSNRRTLNEWSIDENSTTQSKRQMAQNLLHDRFGLKAIISPIYKRSITDVTVNALNLVRNMLSLLPLARTRELETTFF